MVFLEVILTVIIRFCRRVILSLFDLSTSLYKDHYHNQPEDKAVVASNSLASIATIINEKSQPQEEYTHTRLNQSGHTDTLIERCSVPAIAKAKSCFTREKSP